MLNVFARLGAGFDIVSGGELARVLAAGGKAENTVFSGVGKTADEMREALAAGVKCFNVESIPELRRAECGRDGRGQEGARFAARESGRRREDASVYFHRPEVEQVRRRVRRRARHVSRSRAR